MSTPSGKSKLDNTHSIFKITPPVLTKVYDYYDWNYDLSVWEAITCLCPVKTNRL